MNSKLIDIAYGDNNSSHVLKSIKFSEQQKEYNNQPEYEEYFENCFYKDKANKLYLLLINTCDTDKSIKQGFS